jgi:hypothetical protein
MANELTEYLKAHPAQGFKSRPQYFADGDYVSYFLTDERCYARRIDSLLTLYHSLDTDEIVGCKIKGVRRLLQKLDQFGVMIQDDDGAVLGLLFLAAQAETDDPKQKDVYEKIGQRIGQTRIEKSELAIA